GAVGRCCPVALVQVAQQREAGLKLGGGNLGDPAGCDRRDLACADGRGLHHRSPFALCGGEAQWNSWSTRGARRVKRPWSEEARGWLASCWDMTPATRTENSASPSSDAAAGCSSPRSAAAWSSRRISSTSSRLGANASADGSKPGTGRQL